VKHIGKVHQENTPVRKVGRHAIC